MEQLGGSSFVYIWINGLNFLYMELIDPATHFRDRKWRVAQVSVLIVSLIVVMVCFVTDILNEPGPILLHAKSVLPEVNLLHVGTGCVGLTSPIKNSAVAHLVADLIVRGVDSRPHHLSNSTLRLGLKTGMDQQDVVCGQTLFITEQRGIFSFSSVATEVTVTPVLVEGRKVVVEIDWKGKREQVELFPPKWLQCFPSDLRFLQLVQQGSYWGLDLFLEHCGGAEYRNMSSKYRIEMGGEFYFVEKGDFLWWDGANWRMEDSSFQTDRVPLMHITSATPQSVCVKVWDAHGYVSSVVELACQTSSQAIPKFEEIMTAIRMRTPTAVTCQLGKRRVIVKEGDWWVHHHGRWKILNRQADLEAFVQHELAGELFIFDKIENHRDKLILQGRGFDSMRTSMAPISLELSMDKKAAHLSSRGGGVRSSMNRDGRVARQPHTVYRGEEE